MKRIGMILACVAAWAIAARAAPPAPRADWAEQNGAMGYLVMHLSNINAINGLNLTRDQAVRLRDLAREVAAVAPAPNLDGAFRPDLAEVRDVYLDVRRNLLAGEEVGEPLRQKVAAARRTQALVARLSLVNGPSSAPGCAKCHAEPQAPDVRKTADALAAESQSVPPPLGSRKDIFLAHHTGVFGVGGTLQLIPVARQVDQVLTSGQKEALRGFSCCLVPPKDLSDPVRIGQADGGEVPTRILRYVRTVPDDQWPTVRTVLLEKADGIVVLLQPGASEARKADVRRTVAEVYEKARALSAVDFELEKDDLSRRLTQAARTPKDPLSDNQQVYTRAMFLMVPGAVEAYDRLIARLDGAGKVTDARQAPPAR